jgi:gliding motility-associated-like protein
MQRLLLLGVFYLIFSTIPVFAQIVSNGNFDESSNCPPGLGNIPLLDGWFDVVQSADYYDCGFTSSIFPTGNEPSPCGTGYVGFASYGSIDASEAIGQQLAQPLVAGQTYEIEMSLKMTTGGQYNEVCGGLCFYGFTNQPPNVTGDHPALMPGSLELGCTSTVSNTVWQTYTLQFVAPAGVNYFVVTPELAPGCGQNLFLDCLEVEPVDNVELVEVCEGEDVLLDPGIGAADWYELDNGNQVFLTTAATYTYTGGVNTQIQAIANQETTTYDIVFIPLPEPDLGDDITACTGTPVVLNVGAGFDEILWNGVPGNSTFNVTQSGVYGVEVSVDGCAGEDEVTVAFLPIPTATNVVVTDASCEGACDGSIVFQGNANWNITLNNAAATNQNTDLCAGAYTLVVELDGCSTTTNYVVNEALAPVIDAMQDLTICAGETIQLTATSAWNGLIYTWDNGDQGSTISVTPADGDTFCVSAVNASGCAAESVCVDVVHYPALAISDFDDAVVCPGTLLNFAANVTSGQGTYTYNWLANGVNVGSTAALAYTATETADVTLIVTDACTPIGVSTSFNVEVIALPEPELVVTENEVCVPGAIGFSLTDPDAYLTASWGIEGFGLTAGLETTQVFDTPGCFDVTVDLTTPEGCAVSLTVDDAVCALAVPIADFGLFEGDEVYVETGSSTTLNQSQFATQYSWSINGVPFSEEESPVIESWELPGIYELCLVATNDLGCSDELCVTIEVLLPPSVFVPNAFTPDYDGINDVFIPVLSFDPVEYELLIFDRWGETVFISTDSTQPWLGNVTNGDYFAQTEAYLYRLTVRMPDTGNNVLYEGTVTMLR